MGWPKIWKDNRSAPKRTYAPDGYIPQRPFMTGHTPAGQAPTNDPGPYVKTVDSIPPGEKRVQFSLTAGVNQIIFTSTESVPVEICEIFFQSVGASNAQILVGGNPVTAPIELTDSMGYSDAGFTLTQGQNIGITVTGVGTVAGFVRWRYN